jgi:hypothetical protein
MIILTMEAVSLLSLALRELRAMRVCCVIVYRLTSSLEVLPSLKSLNH